jgi:hypothetical protein
LKVTTTHKANWLSGASTTRWKMRYLKVELVQGMTFKHKVNWIENNENVTQNPKCVGDIQTI